jgi:hypothetical protein
MTPTIIHPNGTHHPAPARRSVFASLWPWEHCIVTAVALAVALAVVRWL